MCSSHFNIIWLAFQWPVTFNQILKTDCCHQNGFDVIFFICTQRLVIMVYLQDDGMHQNQNLNKHNNK